MLELAEITIDWISQKCDVDIPSKHKCKITWNTKKNKQRNVRNRTAELSFTP